MVGVLSLRLSSTLHSKSGHVYDKLNSEFHKHLDFLQLRLKNSESEIRFDTKSASSYRRCLIFSNQVENENELEPLSLLT